MTIAGPTVTEELLAPHQSLEHAGSPGPLVSKIVSFLQDLGLSVHYAPVPDDSFLPGLELVPCGLRVDPERLRYPGDLLHEAGHLAVMEPARRSSQPPGPINDGDEIAAIAWSYAAAVHLKLPIEVLFHDDGYKGGAASLRSNFSEGRYIGVPLLQWMGLTTERSSSTHDTGPVYPRMTRWLRQ